MVLFASGMGLAWWLADDAAAPGPAWLPAREVRTSGDALASRNAFSHPQVTLGIGGGGSSGFLTGTNLAPGEVVTGALTLETSTSVVGEAGVSFSFSIDPGLTTPYPAGLGMDEAMLLTSLRYGGEELVGGASRDLVSEIDAATGNADGKLSLRELSEGPVHLVPPAAASDGGTVFEAAVVLDPDHVGDGTEFAGQGLDVTFTFTLTDARVDPTVPGVPGTPELDLEDGIILVRWAPPGTDGGAPITGYRVLRAIGTSHLAHVATVEGPEFQDDDVLARKDYTYRVAARNTAGTGPVSDSATITIPARGTSGPGGSPSAPPQPPLEPPSVEPPAEDLPVDEPAVDPPSDTTSPDAGPDGSGLEPGSTAGRRGSGGGSGPEEATGPGASTPTAPPSIVLTLQDGGVADRPTDGVSGDVRIRVDNVADPSKLVIVVVTPNGTEIVLAEGATEAEWDTSGFENGWYRVETREQHDDGTYEVLTAKWVLVFNAPTSPTIAAAGIAIGVAASLAASMSSGVFSVIGSALATRWPEMLGFLREAAGAVGEDRLRERAARRRVWLVIPSLLAGAIAVVVFAVFFTFEGVKGWDPRSYLASLPIVGLAALVFFAFVYAAEAVLARSSGAKTKFRLLPSGILGLAASAIILRETFGYAGYVAKDDIGDDEARAQRRLKAMRALAVSGLVLGTIGVFLLAGFFWRFDFTEWGLTVALTALATSTMPLRPLPGHEVWRFSKSLAVAQLVAAFGIYYLFRIGELPASVLIGLATVGVGGFIFCWWSIRRRRFFLHEADLKFDVPSS
ncbi:MAG TPA: fibronectin type III domain-containing protein [Candidatus Thermoplasmatota archaeon]|nr:fibronectin type III domain-containing protein [Candidatus Thermoplasmatota archaeon]